MKTTTRPARHHTLAAAIGLLIALPSALAQTPPALRVPDVGRVLQQPPQPVQPIAPSVQLTIPTATSTAVAPGGPQVLLTAVRVQGATRYAAADLQALLADALGRQHDLAGLRQLAERITAYYRDNGLAFARAYVPAQGMADGELLIEVVEGRYGQVRATAGAGGDAALASGAQEFLGALQPGAVIETRTLERATLLLGDLPGLRSSPTIEPGQAVGTGDLVVQVAPGPRWAGEVGVDNHGNRYTGANRLRANLSANRLLRLGDELQVGLLVSDGDLWLGQVGYALPLNGDGLRGQISASRTAYQLGHDFSALGVQGQASVLDAALKYPLLRSVPANLLLTASWQHKRLNDEVSTAGTSDQKRSQLLPLSLQFDTRDTRAGLALGGVTYGSVAWTPGRLTLDAAQQASDAQGKRSAGRFNKINLDLNRLQTLPGNLTLLARLAGQWASKNLDSSEAFSLGGANGVRAYPLGEAAGDSGGLAQVEVRGVLDPADEWGPYGFYDAGQVRYNTDVFQPGDNQRSIAGAGAGLRYNSGRWSLDASAAWRTHGGAPRSDSRDSKPRVLMTASWKL